MSSLLVTSQVGGLAVMLFVLYLLYRGRIFVDTTTNEVIEFNLPFQLRLKTQTPAVMMLLIGLTMVVLPLWWNAYHPQMITLKGEVDTGGHPVVIAVIAQPHYSIAQQESGKFIRLVPMLPDETYTLYFLSNNVVVKAPAVDVKDGVLDVGKVNLQIPASVVGNMAGGLQ